MKALSLWQPWASLWCSQRKIHETRSWPLKHRGWLAVHAAKLETGRALAQSFGNDVAAGKALIEICIDEFGGHWSMDLPRGAVIGAVKIVDCVITEEIRHRYSRPGADAAKCLEDLTCGNFGDGRFGFMRSEFILLPRPVPFKGRQNLFDVPHDIFAGSLELPQK